MVTQPPTTNGGPSGLSTGGPAVEVVRSEERLRVNSEVRVSGRAVLRRFVVTETVTQTFQVRHEEVRLDYEPVNADTSMHGPAFDDRVVETVLHREVPVVSMRVEATERVRVHVDTVTENVQVTEAMRTEQLDLDVPSA